MPFEERVVVFQGLLLNNKVEYQNADSHFMVGSNIHVTVRRNYLYEDAFEKLSVENGKYLLFLLCFILVIFLFYNS